MKDAFYFPHFSNARHDRKIKRLRKELGIEGYGIYFMLLETLRDQHDMMYPLEDCDLLAEEFGTSNAKVKTVICNYQLFDFSEDEKFFSPKMLVYLEPYFRMKEQRREAGLASARKREINDRSTTVQQRKEKESKEEESKRDIIWDRWFKFKAEKNQSYKPIGKQALLKKFESESDERLEAIIEQSIVNNYSGLFPLKAGATIEPVKQTSIKAIEIQIPDNY